MGSIPGNCRLSQRLPRAIYKEQFAPILHRSYSSSSCLAMKNKKGKTVAKENLPSKICVVCNRPFTWRKKWERNWDEVTTCSKSCNSKRKASVKKQEQIQNFGSDNDSVETIASEMSSMSVVLDKKALRKQH